MLKCIKTIKLNWGEFDFVFLSKSISFLSLMLDCINKHQDIKIVLVKHSFRISSIKRFKPGLVKLKNKIMYTTYHLKSAQELNTDILDAIKATYKSRPITIIVEEDDSDFELTADMKVVLDERLQEDESTYLTAEESIDRLNKKYGV